MLKAVVVGAKNNLANQTFMSYDMTLIDYMKDRIPKNVLWKLPSGYDLKASQANQANQANHMA